MQAHEVLKEVLSAYGFKRAASEMRLTQSLLYKWCQPRDSAVDSRAESPLDRLWELVSLTGDDRPIQWLCHRTGGFFVRNPTPAGERDSPILQVTQVLLKEFSDVLQAVSEGYANDNAIRADEAVRIRSEWEQLKVRAEQFVLACEQGVYGGEAPVR